MVANVKNELELYEPMRKWLHQYLVGKFPNAQVQTFDTHAQSLDVHLGRAGVLSEYPQTVGLDIQIDVLGLVGNRRNTELYFIEAKKEPLNLHHLGQLWAYCKLCDPQGAFLLSSVGLGGLNKILNCLSRLDILEFGEGKLIKKMQVAKWDILKSSIDYNTLVPKLC